MENIEALLKKLAEGSITPAEEAFFFEWLQDHKDEWSLHQYESYTRLVNQRSRLLPEERSALLLKAIHSRIQDQSAFATPHEDPYSIETGERVRRLPVKIGRYLAIAASIVLLLTLVWNKRDSLSTTPEESTAASAGPDRKIVNSKKTILPVALPDGSSVLLYPNSTLVFDTRLGQVKREVSLEGKAFFEIMRNPDQPFLVHANEMVTRVLGTSFMIEAYADHPRFVVAVKTGQVAVSAADDGKTTSNSTKESVALHENEETTFDRQLRTFVAPSSDPGPPSLRNIPKMSKEYQFREVPVIDIFARLSQDYNVSIRADKATLASCSLTTTLKDKPLFEKLRIICETIGPGTSFSIEEETIVIKSLGCNN